MRLWTDWSPEALPPADGMLTAVLVLVTVPVLLVSVRLLLLSVRLLICPVICRLLYVVGRPHV